MNSSATQVSCSARRAAARRSRDSFLAIRINVIRDRASDPMLPGASHGVDAALNRACFFERRMGKHPDRVLQVACNGSRSEGLRFEVPELLKERQDANVDYSHELKALEQIDPELQGLVP